jgi:hypothetical protein
MKRIALLAGAMVLAASVSGCVANPKKTVLNLDTTDPKWTSPACVAVRKGVAKYHDGETGRAIVGFAGDRLAPYAGTGATLVMSQHQDAKRAAWNKEVKEACVTRHHHWL